MKIEIDTHTHTVISGHAYSTLSENITAARQAGLLGLVMTEHGPDLQGGAPYYVLGTYGIVPETIDGIRIYRGTEANILDSYGRMDIPDEYLQKADFALCSMHKECIRPANREQDTLAMVNALKNPYISAVAHPGNPSFNIDIEAVVNVAKECDKCIEINSHSFEYRKGSAPICEKFVLECKKQGVKICVGSDAHIQYRIGYFKYALDLLIKHDFVQELIINLTKESFERYIYKDK